MKIILILSVLIQLTYAVEFFKSGTIYDTSSRGDQSFDYIDVSSSVVSIDINFSINNNDNSYMGFRLFNGNSMQFSLSISKESIIINDNSFHSIFSAEQSFSLDTNVYSIARILIKPKTYGQLGSIIKVTLYSSNDIVIYETEILGMVGYVNASHISTWSSDPQASFLLTVTPVSMKRNVVVVPMF